MLIDFPAMISDQLLLEEENHRYLYVTLDLEFKVSLLLMAFQLMSRESLYVALISLFHHLLLNYRDAQTQMYILISHKT